MEVEKKKGCLKETLVCWEDPSRWSGGIISPFDSTQCKDFKHIDPDTVNLC